MQRPGIYKVIWHNSYSYLKSKVLKYRLRILEKKEHQADPPSVDLHLEDLFMVNDLNDKEDLVYRAFK